jgi:hypothetical protein
MRRLASVPAVVAVVLLAACSGGGTHANGTSSTHGTGGAGGEAGTGGGTGGETGTTGTGGSEVGVGTPCSVGGVQGVCENVSVCAAMSGYVSTPGYCPGPADVECCTSMPSVSDNPPIPAGYKLMMQSEVTPEMTDWAVMILHDPVTYPMFSTTTKTFGTLMVLARVEWHPPDFQNNKVHRGVTLYEPV